MNPHECGFDHVSPVLQPTLSAPISLLMTWWEPLLPTATPDWLMSLLLPTLLQQARPMASVSCHSCTLFSCQSELMLKKTLKLKAAKHRWCKNEFSSEVSSLVKVRDRQDRRRDNLVPHGREQHDCHNRWDGLSGCSLCEASVNNEGFSRLRVMCEAAQSRERHAVHSYLITTLVRS